MVTAIPLLVLAQPIRSGVQLPQPTFSPMPKQERKNPDYRVWLDNREVPVYNAIAHKRQHGERYGFVVLESSGPVQLRVASRLGLNETRIRGNQLELTWGKQGDSITFSLPGPGNYSFEPKGAVRNLFIVVNSPRSIPSPDPKVIRFGPGVHRVPGDVVKLTSNQTLFLEAGAVLQAAVNVENAENVKIQGQGIIDGSRWPWLRGPQNQLLRIKKSRNVSVENVIFRGSYGWTIVPYRSRDITISNVRIFNDRTFNDDGIDICNSQRVTITGCLIRSDDDNIAVKGTRLDRDPELHLEPVDAIKIENCLFWNSRARVIALGHESEAAEMSNITVRNSEALYTSQTAFLLEPGEDMLLRDVRFENLRVNLSGKNELALLRPIINEFMKYKQTPGRIRDVQFSNIVVTNPSPTRPLFLIRGHSKNYDIARVTIDNVLVQDSERFPVTMVKTDAFATEVRSNRMRFEQTSSRVSKLP